MTLARQMDRLLPDVIRRGPRLQDIQRLQAVLEQYPQEDLEPAHFFAAGLYARELYMPRGVLIVGRIHRHQHLCIQVSGDVLVYAEGWGKRRVTGYGVLVSDPGAKRVLLPLADTRWVTLHANPHNIRSVHAIEDELTERDDPEAMEQFRAEAVAALKEAPCLS